MWLDCCFVDWNPVPDSARWRHQWRTFDLQRRRLCFLTFLRLARAMDLFLLFCEMPPIKKKWMIHFHDPLVPTGVRQVAGDASLSWSIKDPRFATFHFWSMSGELPADPFHFINIRFCCRFLRCCFLGITNLLHRHSRARCHHGVFSTYPIPGSKKEPWKAANSGSTKFKKRFMV